MLLPVPPAKIASFLSELERRFAALSREAGEELRREHNVSRARLMIERRLDVRYAGQAYEIQVPFVRDFARHFHQGHERAYGYAHTGRPIEVVSLRVRLILPIRKPGLGPQPESTKPIRAQPPASAIVKRKLVWFGSSSRPTPLYDRDRLLPGMRFAGAAIVVEYSSTTVVPPEFVCTVDEYGDLVLRRGRNEG